MNNIYIYIRVTCYVNVVYIYIYIHMLHMLYISTCVYVRVISFILLIGRKLAKKRPRSFGGTTFSDANRSNPSVDHVQKTDDRDLSQPVYDKSWEDFQVSQVVRSW